MNIHIRQGMLDVVTKKKVITLFGVFLQGKIWKKMIFVREDLEISSKKKSLPFEINILWGKFGKFS